MCMIEEKKFCGFEDFVFDRMHVSHALEKGGLMHLHTQ